MTAGIASNILSRGRIGQIAALVVIAALVAANFLPIAPNSFFGDDLSALVLSRDGQFAGSFWQAATAGGADKYRPIPQVLLWLMFSAFGNKHSLYLIVCLIIQTGCGFLFFMIAKRYATYAIALVTACVFSTIRLAYFHFTIIGVIESLALLFFLGALLASVRLHEAQKLDRSALLRVLGGLLALFTAAIFTHERYLAIAPWVLAVVLLSPHAKQLSCRSRIAFVGAVLTPIVANFAYKYFVLKSQLATGTGGQPLAFEPQLVSRFIPDAILTLLGFNSGEPHLAGYVVRSVTDLAAIASIAFIALVASLCAVWAIARPSRLERGPSLTWVALLVPLGCLLLVPPFLTFRMEHRWLVEPAGLLLLMFTWVGSNVVPERRAYASALTIAALLFYAAADKIILYRSGDLYLRQASGVTDALAVNAATLGSRSRVDLLMSECEWILNGGGFFRVYGPNPKSMVCYDSLRAWRADASRTETILVFDQQGKRFEELRDANAQSSR